jgi:glutamate:Na+ symporter, ESS family
VTQAIGQVFTALLVAALLLLAGRIIRRRVEVFRRIFLPSSIIAGFLGLLLGPQVLGWAIGRLAGTDAALSEGVFPAFVLESWAGLPGLLINVVFAALFLGHAIPGLREIWYRAGPQVVFGQTVAWGQYVVGLSLALVVLAPLFGTNPIAGALIEIGFEGGHGTAAGMAGAFEAAGFEGGADLALALATVGIVSGVLIGTVLINWAIRRGHASIVEKGERHPASLEDGQLEGELTATDLAALQQEKRMEGAPTDPLSIHLGVVGLAIGLGWLMLEGLQRIEAAAWGGELFTYVPLFPLAMIGGVAIQIVVDRMGWGHHLSRRLMARISGAALDFTIVTALATLSLAAVGEHLIPFLVLSLAGIAWCVLALVFIAPRVMPFNWFERGAGDFGQSMGVTVTGLLLMRMADPENRSGAMESFGYKQLLFEPVVGGGLFTGMSVGLIAQYGPVPILVLCSVFTAGWLLFGFLHFGPMVREARARGQR